MGSEMCIRDSSYTDAGARALDNFDGWITSNIVTSGSVDTATAGTYTLTYNVSDAAGNAAIPVTRTVIVLDTTPPVISLIGDSTITISQGDTYDEEGATADDNFDGDISADIVVTGNQINYPDAGTHIIRYNVSDAAGNQAAQVTRTIIIFTRVFISHISFVKLKILQKN